MAKAIFLTGGAGFVGQHVLGAFGEVDRPVVALDRSGSLALKTGPRVEVVRGDLLDPASYRGALKQCDTVIHLAAATGKASRQEHFRINARGTRTLLEEAKRAGVSRMLFVSSIATTFPDLRGYHYAQAKLEAEEIVRQSGLRFAIVRPTIIWGPGSAIAKALEKLALLPMIALPGSGKARVQPIHVRDVARAITTVIKDDLFPNEVFEIGGPDVVTMEELLQELRRARKGQSGRVLRLPLGLMRPPLAIAEAAGLGRVLPLTAGQLSSFQYDGVTRPNRLQESLAPGMTTLNAMVEGVNFFDIECQTFTRYLIGKDADQYVRSKYFVAHQAHRALVPATPFDATLLGFAGGGPIRARLADSYAAIFAPASTLRKKLVLLLAILETSKGYSPSIDAALSSSKPVTWLRLAGAGTLALFTLAVGFVIFTPMRLIRSSKAAR